MFIHTETMVPEFVKYDNDTLPLKNLVFKREKLMTDYLTLVKPNENYDLLKNKGIYEMKPDFNLGILMDMS